MFASILKEYEYIVIFIITFVFILLFKTIFDFITGQITQSYLSTKIKYVVDKALNKPIKQHKPKEITLQQRIQSWEKTRIIAWFSVTMIPIAMLTFVFSFTLLSFLTVFIIYSAGVLFIYLLYTMLAYRRAKQFTIELPEALDLLARSVAAGLSVVESFKVVAENFTGLMAEEFHLINDSILMGSSLHEALEDAANRINISEFRFFTIIIFIHEHTGGNVTQLLADLSNTLRDKRTTDQKIQALSSEPIASAVIIGILPPMVIVVLAVISPTYIAPLIKEQIGHTILAFCLFAQVIGVLIMKKIIKVDI